ncbi:MAG: uncharacterized protein QOK43_121 [Acidimicrobiaceae bacterium]|nr:uncharacterized protein [Acidimicrobiaceae bacterium]
MPEMTSYEPGTPSWVDLGTPSVSEASAFYAALFGWEVEDQGADAGGYAMCKLNGKTVAGLGPQMNPGPPYWTTYVTSDDADKTVQLIEEAGGTVLVPPMDVFDAGRMAVAVDPTGAAFSVWQPNQHIGAQLVNEAGTLCWNELTTRDTAKAAAFYEAVFGWGAKSSDAEPGMTYTEFQLGDRSIGGMMEMGADMPADVPSHWLAYFAVADTDETLTKAEAGGGSAVTPTMDLAVGRMAVLKDPHGALFAVIQLAEAPHS